MPGPALPVNVDTTYADDGGDASVKLHQQHHDTVHSMLNKFNTDLTPTDGQILVGISGLWTRSDSVTAKTPEQYGAVGDGVTDDSVALNAWAAAGGDLYLPPKTYLHNGVTAINGIPRPRISVSNTTLRGAGPSRSKIVSSLIYDGVDGNKNFSLFLVGTSGGAEISDVHIEGVGFEYTSAPTVRGTGTCLQINRVHNVKVLNCRMRLTSYGMEVVRAHDFEIAGCEVYDVKADGIQMSNGTDTLAGMTVKNGLVHDNYIHDTQDDAIAVGGKQDGGVNRSQPENVLIYNNIIHTVTVAGGGIGVYGLNGGKISGNWIKNTFGSFVKILLDNTLNHYPSANIAITDNDCFSDMAAVGSGSVGGTCAMRLGGQDWAFSGTELDIPFMDNIRIENNRFVFADRSGLWCQPHSTLGSHPNKWLRRIVIRNNQFIFTGSTTAKVFKGLHLQYIDDLEVSGNRFEGFPHRAVHMNQFKKLRFNENEFSECLADSTYNTLDMVDLGDAATATDSIIDFSQNVFRKTSGTVNRMLDLRADATAGAHPYEGNRFYTTGATITTAQETFQNRPTVPAHVAQSAWDRGHVKLGDYRLWVDSTGDLRIKSGAPASDTDGTIVGLQS